MLFDEDLLTFSEAAKALPRINGSRPHASTIWRWAKRGLDGVKLETRRVGGRAVTSKQALERFTEALAGVETTTRERNTSPKPRSPKRRADEIARAERELEMAGL
jgi:hypothetical protein